MTTRRRLLALATAAAFPPGLAWAGGQAAPHVTNTDEAKVGSYTLPDPLMFRSGAPVRSVGDWRRRRAEILSLFEENQFGRTPSRRLPMRVEAIERAAPGFGGLSRRTQVRLRFSDDPHGPAIHVLLNTPARASAPPPVILSLSFEPNVMVQDEPGVVDNGGFDLKTHARTKGRDGTRIGHPDVKAYLARGYAVATVYYGDIEPDFAEGRALGVRRLFGPRDKPRAPDEWGSMGAWAWGASRVLDWLLAEPQVDGKRVAITGASRLGKAALWAGARDERFAVVLPSISGEGGAALSRRDFGETIADITASGKYGYWFCPRYADYAPDPNTSPVDAHMLLALVAPRPMLLTNGSTDTWSDPTGEWLAAQAAAPVWRLLGRSGPPAQRPPFEAASTGDLAVFTHAGPHTVTPSDIQAQCDFLDARLRA